jgi:putative PIN family toxin of toxin-antitoxin system
MGNRTVVDTNIWVSHVIDGKFYDLAKIAVDYDVVYLPSLPLIVEIKEVLSRKKFAKYNIDLDEFINLLLDISTFCHTEPTFKNCPDTKDNFLFDLAIQGKARYLVSGDKKVLETPIESKTLKITTLIAFKQDLSQNIYQ